MLEFYLLKNKFILDQNRFNATLVKYISIKFDNSFVSNFQKLALKLCIKRVFTNTISTHFKN